MKIGVPKEIKPQENRIGLTPESVKTLVSEGHEVIIENNGGYEAGFENEQYIKAGAKIANTAEDIFDDAEIIVKVKEPQKSEVEMIKEIDGTITYELPDHLLGIIWKGKYKGQKQKWFLMRFLGNDEEINIKTNKPEFLEWKWIDLDKLTEVVVDFKLHVYKELKEKIKKIIN